MDSEFPWTDKSKLHEPLKEFDPAAFAKELKERAGKPIQLPSEPEQPAKQEGPRDLVYRSTDPKPEFSVGPAEPPKDGEMPRVEQVQLQETSSSEVTAPTSDADAEPTSNLGNAGFELTPEDSAGNWMPCAEGEDFSDGSSDEGISDDDDSDFQQQPYFHPPQPDGGAIFSPGTSFGDLNLPEDTSSGDDGSSVESSALDPIEDQSDSTADIDQESENNTPSLDSTDLSPRATGLLQNTADGGPPLARPMVLVSLTSAATQRLIEESLSAASQRDSKTLESIAKAKVHDAFWIRDAQRRAVTGDW